MRILYGGSVKAEQCRRTIWASTMSTGALVGGASLKSSDFLAICKAFENASGLTLFPQRQFDRRDLDNGTARVKSRQLLLFCRVFSRGMGHATMQTVLIVIHL